VIEVDGGVAFTAHFCKGDHKGLAQANSTIEQLTDFRTRALAQLAAQHDEIARLRRLTDQSGHVRRLPNRPSVIGSCN
jgi:hypothetical protein